MQQVILFITRSGMTFLTTLGTVIFLSDENFNVLSPKFLLAWKFLDNVFTCDEVKEVVELFG